MMKRIRIEWIEISDDGNQLEWVNDIYQIWE